MEKRFVTVRINNGEFKMELIQFITVPDGKFGTVILAICMDETGAFETYGMDSIRGESF
jgi:hypothetical protein